MHEESHSTTSTQVGGKEQYSSAGGNSRKDGFDTWESFFEGCFAMWNIILAELCASISLSSFGDVETRPKEIKAKTGS